jgi:hypothetical protein
MSTQLRPLASIALTALLAGCSGLVPGAGTTTVGSSPYVVGSGKVASDPRVVESFHAVSAAEGVRVEVAAGAPSVVVTADENLLDHVVTTVADGVLSVDVSGSVQTRNPMTVVVRMDVPPDGLSASTGASIDAAVASSSSLRVDASTGGRVHGTGTAEALTVAASTGATADLADLPATRVDVDASTGASIVVQTTGPVTGSATGGSSVRVRGGGSIDGIEHDTSSTVEHQ